MAHTLKLNLVLRASVSALVVGGGAMLATQVTAQTARATLSIPAQPLASALRELGRQANAQIIFQESDVRALQSATVNTSGGLDVAMRQLLSGTGLAWRKGRSGVIIVERGARLASNSQAQQAGTGTSDAPASGESAQSDEMIVVTGTRASIQTSLSDQKSRDNVSTVLSSDISGKFPDSTLAETMRRAPGVSFQRSERGGEGEFISIRGLDSGLNNVQINGVNAGTASGSQDRRVPLDVFQAGTVSEIVINKSLLPQHDGEGIGGAVELNTRNPLSVRKPSIDLTAEGRYGEFADKLGYSLSGAVTTKFGADEQFGITLAASYRSRKVQSFVYDFLGDYSPAQIPLTADPDGRGFIDRLDTTKWQAAFGDDFTADDFASGDDLRVEDIRANKFDLSRDNLSLTGAFGWHVSPATTMLLSGTFNDSKETNRRSTFGFEQSDRWDLSTDPTNFYGRNPFFRARGETEDEDRTAGNAVLKFDTEVGRWRHTYGAGWSFATSEIPFSVEADFLIRDLDEDDPFGTGALLPEVQPTGRRFIDFDLSGDVPKPLLTDAGWAALGDPSLASFNSLDMFEERERNDRYSVFIDSTYDVDGSFLKSIRYGAKFERSDFQSFARDLYDDDLLSPDGTLGDGDFTLADTNLLDGTTSTTSKHGDPMGSNMFFYNYDRDALLSFGRNAVASLDGQMLEFEQLDTREEIYAAYLQGAAETGNWQFIGGARLEHVRASTLSYFTNDEDVVDEGGAPEISTENSGRYTSILPRLQVNYRPSEDLVFRGAFFTSIARPELDDLGELKLDFVDLVLPDPGDPTQTIIEEALSVRLPNPALDPAYSYNFDLGAEWYFSRSGVLSANLFYKKIDNFVYAGVKRSGTSALTVGQLNDLPGFENVDFTQFDDVVIRQAANGDTAKVYGVELNFNAQLDDYVDAWYGGFGVLANLTVQKSETDIPITDNYSRTVRFFNSPDYIGNVALTYEKYGLDASLSYSFQDRQLDSVEPFLNMDEWEQPYSSLDLRVEYTLPMEKFGRWAIFGRVSDITNSGDRPINWETKGRGKRYLDDIEYIGREWRFGVRARF